MRDAIAVPALLALATAAWAAAPLPPKPTKYATDRARTFDAARLGALNERLAEFERQTSNQVIVYVDRRLPAGTTLEEMSSGAMRAWGVGQQGKRNGVALFVFVDDRKMRIEVGYGLEGALPDAAAHRITDGVIKPHFKKGDYAAGVEAGVNAILAAVQTEANRGTGVTAAEKARGVTPAAAASAPLPPTRLGWLCPLVALSPLAFWPFLRSFLRAMAWGSLGAGLFAFVMALALWDGLWFFGAIALLVASLFCWLIVLLQRAVRGRTWITSASSSSSSDSGSSWSGSSGSSWSSSDSGSSSSSDFSGGGGDSGGGGSSDSW